MFVGCVARTVLISALLCCVVLCFRNPFHNREVYMNKLDVKPQPPRHILFSAVLLGSKDDAANDKQSQESPSRGSMQIFSTLEISDPIERQFGLKSEQLRELEEQPLPLPHEVSSNEKSTDGKLFSLPELSEFVRDNKKGKLEKGKARRTKGGISNEQAVQKVNRKNQEEYTKVLQLSPFADADKDIFVEEYDIFQSVFGMGTLLSIPVPYLQSGHLMLLFVSALAALVYAPGNPLTEFPTEIREFLQVGLKIVFSINTVLAAQAFLAARQAKFSGLFWFFKVFLLGGIASYELSELTKKT